MSGPSPHQPPVAFVPVGRTLGSTTLAPATPWLVSAPREPALSPAPLPPRCASFHLGVSPAPCGSIVTVWETNGTGAPSTGSRLSRLLPIRCVSGQLRSQPPACGPFVTNPPPRTRDPPGCHASPRLEPPRRIAPPCDRAPPPRGRADRAPRGSPRRGEGPPPGPGCSGVRHFHRLRRHGSRPGKGRGRRRRAPVRSARDPSRRRGLGAPRRRHGPGGSRGAAPGDPRARGGTRRGREPRAATGAAGRAGGGRGKRPGARPRERPPETPAGRTTGAPPGTGGDAPLARATPPGGGWNKRSGS